MNDMSGVITPRSDQINADDLQGRTLNITISGVRLGGSAEQPVSIYFEGSDKAYRPCKSMCRVMVHAWGLDANQYVGKSMTLYCDPNVKFGPLAVGGIRISHMSDIDGPMTMALTATKGVKKAYKVLPLQVEQRQARATGDTAEKWVDDHLGFVRGASDLESLDAVIAGGVKAMTKLSGTNPDLHQKVDAAYTARRQALTEADPFEGRTDNQHGDQHDGSVAGDLSGGE